MVVVLSSYISGHECSFKLKMSWLCQQWKLSLGKCQKLHFRKFKIGQRMAMSCMMVTVDGQLPIWAKYMGGVLRHTETIHLIPWTHHYLTQVLCHVISCHNISCLNFLLHRCACLIVRNIWLFPSATRIYTSLNPEVGKGTLTWLTDVKI